MELDAKLLASLEQEKNPILHLYDWNEDTATYGHFIDPYSLLRKEESLKLGLAVAKRPTGGGMIFHNCDLAFSVLVPATHASFSLNPLDNYAFVNQKVMWVVSRFLGEKSLLLQSEPVATDASKHFCMAKPTKYDVMIGDKKVGGAAQRKTRHGFLHQGSICLGMLPQEYLSSLFIAPGIYENMLQHSFPLLGESWSREELVQARLQLTALLQEAFL